VPGCASCRLARIVLEYAGRPGHDAVEGWQIPRSHRSINIDTAVHRDGIHVIVAAARQRGRRTRPLIGRGIIFLVAGEIACAAADIAGPSTWTLPLSAVAVTSLRIAGIGALDEPCSRRSDFGFCGHDRPQGDEAAIRGRSGCVSPQSI